MGWKTLDNMDISGKKVLLRVDINVPMKADKVSDTTRIEKNCSNRERHISG